MICFLNLLFYSNDDDDDDDDDVEDDVDVESVEKFAHLPYCIADWISCQGRIFMLQAMKL